MACTSCQSNANICPVYCPTHRLSGAQRVALSNIDAALLPMNMYTYLVEDEGGMIHLAITDDPTGQNNQINPALFPFF